MIVQECECDSFVNVNGWGNCTKKETDGRTGCYVKNPDTSTCSDLKGSSTNPDKKYSYEACEKNGLRIDFLPCKHSYSVFFQINFDPTNSLKNNYLLRYRNNINYYTNKDYNDSR